MRGDVVLIAMSGDFGKPRPAVVVQTDALEPLIDSVLVCPLTSAASDAAYFRVLLAPTAENGLRVVSFAMADKTSAVRRTRLGPRVGRLAIADMARLNVALAFAVGLAG